MAMTTGYYDDDSGLYVQTMVEFQTETRLDSLLLKLQDYDKFSQADREFLLENGYDPETRDFEDQEESIDLRDLED